MNYSRIALASLGDTIAYFAIGFLVFTMKPFVAEFQKYPGAYRSGQDMTGVMPIGMLAMFASMVVLAFLYAATFVEWTVFGLVMGLIYRLRP